MGPHHPTPWAIRLRDTLHFIKQYPQYGPLIGLIPIDLDSFFVNSTSLAQFFGFRNRNSCNRDLKQHGFLIDHTCNIIDELNRYAPGITFSPRCWVKRKFQLGCFNGDSSIEETNRASNHARQTRNVTVRTVSDMANTSSETLTKTSASQTEVEVEVEVDDLIDTEGIEGNEGNWFRGINGEWFEW
jgi:hypothetical protein